MISITEDVGRLDPIITQLHREFQPYLHHLFAGICILIITRRRYIPCHKRKEKKKIEHAKTDRGEGMPKKKIERKKEQLGSWKKRR
jgi:hypothetical protein